MSNQLSPRSEVSAAKSWGDYWRHYEWPAEPREGDVVKCAEDGRIGELLSIDSKHHQPYMVSIRDFSSGPDAFVQEPFRKGEVTQHFEVDRDRLRCARDSEYHLRERGCLWSKSKLPERKDPPDKKRLEKKDDLKEWDVNDPAVMEKVVCHMLVKVTAVDPKNSNYELRVKCKWRFRTLHSHERTETRLRVPGIRLPGLLVHVDESRIWKDMEGTKRSKHTILWRGMSRFTIRGFERFEMHHFPFDRQIMSLDIFDFVWRSEQQKEEFDFSMQIAQLHVQTVSVLPEWDPYPAIVSVRNVKKTAIQAEEAHLPHASRFTMRLRLERRTWFYVLQAFGLTVLITISSFVPLCMPIMAVGDRLSVYASGMLTLTSFKYSIADQLPQVPYSNYMDWILFWELVTLMSAALESVLMYRYVVEMDMRNDDDADAHALVRRVEDVFFVVVLTFWVGLWLYFAADQFGWHFGKQHQDWLYVLENQDWQADEDELEDLNPKATKTSLADVIKHLDRVNHDINDASMKIAHADDTGDDVDRLSGKLHRLQDKRAGWEEQLRKMMPREAKS